MGNYPRAFQLGICDLLFPQILSKIKDKPQRPKRAYGNYSQSHLNFWGDFFGVTHSVVVSIYNDVIKTYLWYNNNRIEVDNCFLLFIQEDESMTNSDKSGLTYVDCLTAWLKKIQGLNLKKTDVAYRYWERCRHDLERLIKALEDKEISEEEEDRCIRAIRSLFFVRAQLDPIDEFEKLCIDREMGQLMMEAFNLPLTFRAPTETPKYKAYSSGEMSKADYLFFEKFNCTREDIECLRSFIAVREFDLFLI